MSTFPPQDDRPARAAMASPLAERVDAQRRTRRMAAGALAVAALLLLVLLGSVMARPGMEDSLEKAVAQKLGMSGLPTLTVEASGQDIALSGTVGSDNERARALRDAKVRGVRTVSGAKLVVAATGTAPATAVRILPMTAHYSEGSVTFEGTRPSKEALDALMSAPHDGLGKGQVSDNMVVKGHESDPVDVIAYKKLGKSISLFPGQKVRSAVIEVRDGSIDVTGVLGDESTREYLLASLADVVGDTNRVRDRFTVEPAAPSTSEGSATTAAGSDTTAAGSDTTAATATTQTAGPATTVGPPSSAPAGAAAAAQDAIDAIMSRGRITFATNLAILQSGSAELIQQIAVQLKGTGLRVEVAGYTDNRGDEAKNVALSQQRADAVKAELVKQGVDEAQITAVGRGSANPIASNATAAGQARNRRIEFTVTG